MKKMENVKELREARVAIIVIRHKFEMPRDVPYQVTLDPDEFSDSKDHIRVGNYEGDDLRGWIPTADIEIREWLKTKPSKSPKARRSRALTDYQRMREPQAVAA